MKIILLSFACQLALLVNYSHATIKFDANLKSSVNDTNQSELKLNMAVEKKLELEENPL